MDVIQELMSRFAFSQDAIDLCVQSKCKCAYCTTNVLKEFVDFRFSAKDHLLPKYRYKGLIDAPSNHVLSCHSCNMLKGRWDPNANGPQLVSEDATSLSEGQRDELIQRTITYLETNRKQKESEFEEYKTLLSQLM